MNIPMIIDINEVKSYLNINKVVRITPTAANNDDNWVILLPEDDYIVVDEKTARFVVREMRDYK